MDWKGCGNLTQCILRFFLVGVKKTTENLSREIRSLDHNLKPGLTEYGARVPTTPPVLSLKVLFITSEILFLFSIWISCVFYVRYFFAICKFQLFMKKILMNIASGGRLEGIFSHDMPQNLLY